MAAAMADGVSLGYMQDLFADPITKSEADLKATLAAIKSGADVDAQHLLLYTYEINKSGLTVQMISAMLKERADTLKSACAKF